MNADIQKSAAALREKLAPGGKKSANAKRLGKIAELLDDSGQAFLAPVLTAIYPNADLSTKPGREKALWNFRKFRQIVNEAANQVGMRGFRVMVDGENRKPPQQRLVWIDCGDSNTAATLEIEERNKAETRTQDQIVPPKGQDLFDTRRIVHYYVVYAADAVDARDRNALLHQLDAVLAAHDRFRFRSVDFKVSASGTWPTGIEQEIAHCQFGLLMLTSKFLESGFLGKEYNFCKSALLGASGLPASCIPIALSTVVPREELLSGLPPASVLFGPNGLSWHALRIAPEKEILLRTLVDRILKQLETATTVAGEIEKRSDEEASKDLPGFFERTRGARTRIENAAASAAEAETDGANREDALEFLLSWIQDPAAPPYCALLGEYGMGKTTTCKALTRAITARRGKGEKLPLPIYFDLRPLGARAADRNLEEILDMLLRDSWKSGAGEISVAPRDIIAQTRKTGALVIWDGLDEVLVHLDTAAGQRFTRQLYSILPPDGPRHAGAEGRSRLLITCRTHYFRTLPEQNSHFLAEERDNVRAENYRGFMLLPFTGDQIREYLANTLPGEDISRALATLDSVYNLRELAERPFTLSLIAREFATIERWKAEGRRVTGLTLYRHMVRSWLLRDTGKHQFKPDHKQWIMEHLAARLWQRGQREWSIGNIENWLGELLLENPLFAASYAGKPPELLEEDLRTATFLVREGEDKFRFAHASLQEFFLAGYLRRALVEAKPERWQIPMVTRETLDFLGQWLLEEEPPEMTQAMNTLESLRDRDREKASVLAFKYFLLAHGKRYPSPSPAAFQLPEADLDGWRIEGAADRVLVLNGANFAHATLNQTRWTHCDLEGASFEQASVERAEFVEGRLAGSQWSGASLEAALFRKCDPDDAKFDGALMWQTYFVPPSQPDVSGDAILAVASGHFDGVNCCAWSPDGRRLASASDDKTVRLWDAATGKPLGTLEGHAGRVRSCAWSPDGRRLASVSDDKTVRLWDAATGKPLGRLEGHSDGVWSCAWSPDGRRLASASVDKTVRLWDAATGEPLGTLQGHADSVLSCAWSPDGRVLASASEDNTVRLWDAATGKPLGTLEGHTNSVWSCAWSADGRRLASASADKTVRMWDAATGKPLGTLEGHTNSVWSCAWSADGRRLASASNDDTVRLWDAATGKPLGTLEGHAGGVRSCAWSPDGRRLASASDDRTVRLWDAATGKPLGTLEGHADTVWICAWSPDGRRLASASNDKTVKLWDAATGKPLRTLEGHAVAVLSCAWSPDGRRLASASADNTVRLWDAATGKPLGTLEGHADWVRSCAWSPDGRRLASASDDNTVRLCDAATGKPLGTLKGHANWVLSCAWSPDGRRLASASTDKTLRLWDAATGKPLGTLEGHAGWVWSCAWSPDSRRLASASDDNTVRLWDAATGKPLGTLEGHADWVRSCAWSPDGRRLASASDDNTVRLWDAATGKPLGTLEGHAGRVLSCAWSPDGRRLASASEDGAIRCWDAETGCQLQPTIYHLTNLGAPPSWATIDHEANRVIACGPEAWRSLGWLTPDPDTGLRWLPAEYFGSLPEE